MMQIKIIFGICLMLLTKISFSQNNIIPVPANYQEGNGSFTISPTSKIVLLGSNLKKSATQLQKQIEKMFGFTVQIIEQKTKASTGKNNIVLNYARLDYPIPGAYNLSVTSNEVYIVGDNEQGVFYAIQSLLQLMPIPNATIRAAKKIELNAVEIKDYPRFSYRGAHLDVSRHFFSVDEVKKYIDYLAAYKFNKFHWHLTDDQGWRIEIKKYPKLTSVGGYRNGTIIGRYPGKGNDSIVYGGFYTQEQIKDVVKYAASKYVEVIPEIEMPGHASAAIAAYPELSCFPDQDTKIAQNTTWAGSQKGKHVQQAWGVFEDVFKPSPETFTFLQNVMDEVIPLFPSKYIHIGGDESPKEAWKASAYCQQLIKDSSLKDEHGLQSYFIRKMERYINKKGKKIIGWDEILEGGLAPNATVMSWQGEEGGIAAAKQFHDVIMSPTSYCYLDYSQSENEDSVTIGSYVPVQKVYGYEPIPAVLTKEESKHILGAQVNLWTEYVGNFSKLQYMAYPRVMAFSEVLWSPKDKKDFSDFARRLPILMQRLKSENVNFSRAFYDLSNSVINEDGKLYWKLESNNKNAKIVYTDDSITKKEKVYQSPILITKDVQTSANIKDENNVIIGNWVTQNFTINKATGKKITLSEPPSKSYPGNGAATLVDGVQNKMGLVKSKEFIGYVNKDLEAIIDLNEATPISEINLHIFEQVNSWIHRPASVSFYSSLDGNQYQLLETTKTATGKIHLLYTITKNISARFIKIVAEKSGKIPAGFAGEGQNAWLFADEIEIK